MCTRRILTGLLLAFLLVIGLPTPALADEAEPTDEPLEVVAAEEEAEPLDANSGGTVNVYRLYNRKTSEHLYTTNKKEYDSLPTKGPWVQEGVAWVAPKKSLTPVYRLYNRGLGDHHYTTSKGERDSLTRKGWRYEGIAFYSDDNKRVPLYRVYNGRLKAGQHHYTTSKGERDSLVRNSGWRDEGVGFYAVKKGSPKPAMRHYDFGYCEVDVPASWNGIIVPSAQGHTSGAYHVDFYYRPDKYGTGVIVFRIDGMVGQTGWCNYWKLLGGLSASEKRELISLMSGGSSNEGDIDGYMNNNVVPTVKYH